MKALKLVSLITASLLTFWACDNEADEEPDPSEELLGTWVSNSFEGEVVLITKSDQTILDRNSEGEGAIEVSGTDTASLTYFINVFIDENSSGIRVSNRIMNSQEYPIYYLGLIESGGSKWFDYYIDMQNDGRYYYTDKGDYSYEDFTLTINELKLYQSEWDPVTDSSIIVDSVAVVGTLIGRTIEISANTPTSFPLPDYWSDQYSGITLKLKESDTFILILADGYSITGIWDIENAMLNLYPSQGEILSFTYVLNDNNLTLEMDEDLCRWAQGNPNDYASCLDYAGMEYGLGAGSLDSIVNHFILELSR